MISCLRTGGLLKENVNNCWNGQLNLVFSFKEGRSVLTHHKHSGPFLVQRSFYPEDDKVTPHVYLLHPPGGLVGGDSLILDVRLESGSSALLTTPGCTKFYRTNGMYASQKYIFRLIDDSVLEYLPQGSIFFPRTKSKIDITFILNKASKVIFFDMLCFADVVKQEDIAPDQVDVFLKIFLPFSVGLQERLRLNAVDYLLKLNGYRIIAAFYAIPSNKKMLDQVRELISLSKKEQDILVGGATLLDNLLVVRLLGNDNQSIKELLYHIWYSIRPIIIGKKAVIPRIWFT